MGRLLVNRKESTIAAPRFTESERAQQRIEALRLWMTGATYDRIAEALGVSHQTAYARVQRAIDEMRPHADFDRYRAVQLAELELARRPLRVAIVSYRPGDPLDVPLAAIAALLKVQEREAKLLGLDRAPTPFDELSAMTDDQLAQLVTAWADDLAEADEPV